MSLETGRRVLRIEAQALEEAMARLGGAFERAVEVLFECQGRVAVTGMGKSGIVGRKISATLSSTGTPSFFLHPAEALHGDLGMLARGDIMLAVSYGGETREIIALLDALKRLEIRMVALTGNLKSTIALASEVVLLLEPRPDGQHYGGDGGRRCAGRGPPRKARFSSRRFCGAASCGESREAAAAGGKTDAYWREAASRLAGYTDGRRVS